MLLLLMLALVLFGVDAELEIVDSVVTIVDDGAPAAVTAAIATELRLQPFAAAVVVLIIFVLLLAIIAPCVVTIGCCELKLDDVLIDLICCG